jgi:DNA polymerase-3 subunit delta'
LTKRFPEADARDRAALARLSGGSLGLALKLADEGGLDFARQADALIDAPRPDPPALLAFGDRMWRHADALGEFGGFLLQALAARIRARALAGEERIAGAWLAAYEQIAALYERAVGVNMEPKQTILASAEIVADTKRRAGAI